MNLKYRNILEICVLEAADNSCKMRNFICTNVSNKFLLTLTCRYSVRTDDGRVHTYHKERELTSKSKVICGSHKHDHDKG